MARFLAGFLTASLVWGGGLAAYSSGLLPLGGPEQSTAAPADGDAGLRQQDRDERRRRARARRRRQARRRARRGKTEDVPEGTRTIGGDLSGGKRTMDMGSGGGEEQLSHGRIEKRFNEHFGRIRRCLVLAAGTERVTGRLVFGLKIAGSGEVRDVNLKGPAAVTQGESGQCLLDAARAIKFPSFDGPDMVVHYPITLE